MATLDISYFRSTGRLVDDVYGKMVPGATEQVAIDVTSAQSAGAPPAVAFARIYTDTDCRITDFASDQTASLTYGTPLAAGQTIELDCREGEKIAVIALAFA